MPRRKTNEEWVKEVKSLVKDEYVFLSSYVNKNTKLPVIHNVCGEEYEVEPGAFLNGNRCPYCRSNRKLTTDEFKDKIYKLVGNEYVLLSEYSGHHEHITIKHNKCGKTYEVMASDFLKGRRCKECYFKGRMKTNKEWLVQVSNLAGDDYKFLDEYKGDNVKLRYIHSCGTPHEVTPNNFINGTRCPYCKESSGEANVRRYLTERGIPFEKYSCFEGLMYKKSLNYDFYIPSMNILIEFQGEQHYKPVPFFGGDKNFEEQCIKDNLKREYAKNNNLTLIEIPYDNNTYDKVEVFLDTTMSRNYSAM